MSWLCCLYLCEYRRGRSLQILFLRADFPETYPGTRIVAHFVILEDPFDCLSPGSLVSLSIVKDIMNVKITDLDNRKDEQEELYGERKCQTFFFKFKLDQI